MIYPWHEPTWQQLTAHWQNQPNAWLFTGKANTGKTAFARHFAQSLLCENPSHTHQPCGTCPSCHLFLQGTHPDFYALTPEQPESETGSKKLQQIKIDGVRNILEPLTQSSVRGGRRVVLITPAESLNVQAANALLKMLEEPPEAVIFLLITHNKDRVLPTIKSRCRQLLLPAPAYDVALDYLRGQHCPNAEQLLAFHSGAPLFTLQPEQDTLREKLLDLLAAPRLLAILDYAAEFDKNKLPLAVLLDWLQKWTIDVQLAAQNMPPLYYPHRAEAAKTVAIKTNPATLFQFSGCLNHLHPYGHHSLNVKMQAEYLLSNYLTALR
ncbi:DNA polymerase III subunit delta' [Kingella negevensis]|uniref:DNA polymerase III subunit delta' n=1 Tax=Kingella negevensis TaxID=1522312 RepID=UPI00254329B5|nr:DNA polymerase III subunit delta' [Kingella negevensis]MDK4680317.1 DNA polymerase III subunit delta' [Kingella negevensis]MDK4681962.1 DNA polymerase III subunit delta' [Kingella negevensis]MDK4690158.1 DNA polymerase III subunit delta' [Kingella negevensis]MDK4692496.1 DNA polymerase III subunit delta' [Kingella negevensis]MDK4698797.1 DNA polymerase III subunit delta' [Kingella negevensis]